MSKIKNGGLDQYGKVYSLNGVGGERVKDSNLCMEMHLWRRSCLSTGMLWKVKMYLRLASTGCNHLTLLFWQSMVA